MSGNPSNMAGPALGTPQQSASATPQTPASMDQIENPLFCPDWNGIPQGNQQNTPSVPLNASQFSNQQQFNNQQQYAQGMQNTPSVSLNASQFGSQQQSIPSVPLNASQISNQQQYAQGMPYAPAMSGNSQAQQMMTSSSSAPQSANLASTPLVVSSQMFRRSSGVTQRSSATPQMANSGAGSLNLNQAPMPNAQPFKGNNQGQWMQPSFGNVQSPMPMDNMSMMQNGIGGMQHPFMGNGQASFMGNAPHHHMGNFQPNPMGNHQAQSNNGFMQGGAPNSFMGYAQPQTQLTANMQASHMGTGQGAAHNMSMPYGNTPGNFQNMQSSPMTNVQPYGYIGAQRAQGFQVQTRSPSLNAAAPSFFPAQVNAVSQQHAAPQANMSLQPQMGMMSTPRAAPMAMQTNPQTNRAGQTPSKKRTPKRSRAAKPDNTPKRRNKPVNNTLMQKANNSTRARIPGMGKLMDRLGGIVHGETLPNVGGVVDMTPRPQPKHQVADYLSNPAEHPTTPQDCSTQQLTQQHLMTPPQTSPVQQLAQQPLQLPDSPQVPSVGELSSQSASEEHTSPPTQSQLNAFVEPSAASKEEENNPPELSKKEKWLRQAEAEGRTIPPSRRRVVRLERDDSRVVFGEDGQLVSPKSNMYTSTSSCASSPTSTDTDPKPEVYYVPPIGERSPEEISQDLMEFLLQKMNPENEAGNEAKTNGKKTTKKASKSRSKASTKVVNENNGGQHFTENSTEEVTVSERLNNTAAATTTDTSQVGATDAITTSDAFEPFTVNPSFDPTLSSTIQDDLMDYGYGPQFTSELTAEPANTTMAACNDLIDPTLTEPAKLQQVQDMPKVSDDLTPGSMRQPVPATTEVSSNEEFMMAFAQLQQFNTITEDGPSGPAFLTALESSTVSPTSAETESSVGNHNIASETPESDLLDGSSIDKPNGSPSEMADAPSDVGVTLPEAESSLEGDITSSESPKSDMFSLFGENVPDVPDELLFDQTDAHKSFQELLGDDGTFFPDDKSVSGHATSSYASYLEEPVPGLFGTDSTDPANAHLVSKADHLRNDLASGNNDISVHSVRFTNEPSMRLADMPYSPICSPTYPFAEMSYPPPSPVFEPMDPFNTVLGQYATDEKATKNSDGAEKTTTGTTATAAAPDTTTATNTVSNTAAAKKRKAGEDTGAVPNKKARTSGLSSA